MSFEKLIKKVAQAENAVEANERRIGADLRQLKSSWLSMWTPGRIVIAGLASGFLIGRAEPVATVARGGRLLRSAGTLITLFSGVTAATAAEDAKEAGEVAETILAANGTGAVNAAAASAAADELSHQANERIAHEYLERLASAARQAGGARES